MSSSFTINRDHAIDRDGDRDPDRGEREALHRKRIAVEAGERDRHDLGRQDEVGADRALDLARLELGRRVGGEQFGFVMMVAADFLPDLLGRLERQIGAADHQQRA